MSSVLSHKNALDRVLVHARILIARICTNPDTPDTSTHKMHNRSNMHTKTIGSLLVAALIATTMPEPRAQEPQVAPEAAEPSMPYGSARGLRLSCRADYVSFCSGDDSVPVALEVSCLRQSWANLAPQCRRALEKYTSSKAGGAAEPAR
jgi:hypothetical protein